MQKTICIIGAGPAGLTAAYEILEKSKYKPIIFEMSDEIGGLSKTINFKGNRMDLGGHRFFTKSHRVMNFWENILPVQSKHVRDTKGVSGNIKAGIIDSQRKSEELFSDSRESPNPDRIDEVLLIRKRKSRILYGRKFYEYPIKLNLSTLGNLGLLRSFKIMFSYVNSKIFPIYNESNLEEFFINRFGNELYNTFFKDYTQKVWGIPCTKISPEWGVQRIKQLSISKAIRHAVKTLFTKLDVDSKKIDTSLIEEFYYPKLGPGQMWEKVARIVSERGGEIQKLTKVTGINIEKNIVKSLVVEDMRNGNLKILDNINFVISTMPVKDLITAMGSAARDNVIEIANNLVYRDFVTIGVLLSNFKLQCSSKNEKANKRVLDNWIYIQECDVKLGRIQIFNNWSPYLVKDENTVFIGLEYFCNEGDDFWSKSDHEIFEFALDEMVTLKFIERRDVIDHTIVRVPKAYPAYFGSYDRFPDVRDFVNGIENLFLVGRNGMHRYNNIDHSMLTAMKAVDNITGNIKNKENIWSVNLEEEYHEAK